MNLPPGVNIRLNGVRPCGARKLPYGSIFRAAESLEDQFRGLKKGELMVHES